MSAKLFYLLSFCCRYKLYFYTAQIYITNEDKSPVRVLRLYNKSMTIFTLSQSNIFTIVRIYNSFLINQEFFIPNSLQIIPVMLTSDRLCCKTVGVIPHTEPGLCDCAEPDPTCRTSATETELKEIMQQ